MPVFNVDGFYLGTISDLDPDEGNWNTEYANAIVGQTVGTQANSLAWRIDQTGLNDSNSDGVIR